MACTRGMINTMFQVSSKAITSRLILSLMAAVFMLQTPVSWTPSTVVRFLSCKVRSKLVKSLRSTGQSR